MGQARQLLLQVISDMQLLANRYRTIQELFDAVAKASGVSESMTRKLYYGQKVNPTVDIMDKLSDGINRLFKVES